MLDVGRHPNIELLAYSQVERIEGETGDFRVTVRKKARYVDEEKCTGCGACREKCPTVVPDNFNERLSSRSAIYTYFAQGIPSTHTIDPEYCRQLNGKKCGICQKTCQADAIDFDQKDKRVTIQAGAIIVATGYSVFDPSRIPEYRYRELPNVLTAMEFERLLSASGPTGGHLNRPSDRAVETEIDFLEKKIKKSERLLEKLENKHNRSSAQVFEEYRDKKTEDETYTRWVEKYTDYIKEKESLELLLKKAENFSTATRLAFIQCVGSRDIRFYPYCSGYCCMHSIKEAVIAHEHNPETSSTLFGMDIRAVGKGFEEYKIRGGNQSGITYVRGRVAEIEPGPEDCPVVVYENTWKQTVERKEFDMVILASACSPAEGTNVLSEILGIELDDYGFVKTDVHRPLDTTRPGIFVCGCAHSPMDIPESVAQASSAAARAVQVLTRQLGPVSGKLLRISETGSQTTTPKALSAGGQ